MKTSSNLFLEVDFFFLGGGGGGGGEYDVSSKIISPTDHFADRPFRRLTISSRRHFV